MRCWASSSITGPTVQPGSSAGATFRLRVASTSRSRNASYSDSSTMTREQAEHFWPCVAEGAGDDAVHGLVEVGVVVDDDRVLAAHLGDDALDVVLARRRLGGLAVDEQADAARAGEGDHAPRRGWSTSVGPISSPTPGR